MTGSRAAPGHVLVTGAGGFVGRDLVVRLARAGWRVRAAARDLGTIPAADGIDKIALPDLAQPIDWRPLVDGATHIVHLAGIAHATSSIPEATYQAVNGAALGPLAEAAKAARLARVVMISSVRAQCGPSASGVLDEAATPAPSDAYGRAKLTGERQLAGTLAGAATGWCVLRPVLVYGRGVKGNMGALLRVANSALPLPIARLAARRSLLGLANFTGAVVHALTSPEAAGRTFLAADPGSLTVPEIVAAMREGLGRPTRIVPFPLAAFRIAAGLAGRRADWERMAGDLVVSTAALEASGWIPAETARQGIARWMAETATTAP